MRFFIAIIGIGLVANFAAAADRDAAVYWPGSTTAEPTARPKVVEYAAVAAKVAQTAVKDLPPPNPAAQAAETAPDPPAQRDGVTPAAYRPEHDATAVRLAVATEPVRITEKAQPLTATTALAATTAPAAPQTASSAALSLGGHADKSAAGKVSSLGAAFTVGGSLSIVLGLFLVVAWALRKTAPRGSLLLPREVFDILGRAPLGARQQVQLLRCGNKLLLVSITPHGTETLTEVTDPLEVDRLAGICQQANPKSSTTAFRQVFRQMATKPDEAAETANLDLGGLRRKRYRWEEKHA